MAVTAEIFGKTLKLEYQAGVKTNGDPIIKVISFKAKSNAVDQDIYDVASQINTLQASSLRAVLKEENYELQSA